MLFAARGIKGLIILLIAILIIIVLLAVIFVSIIHLLIFLLPLIIIAFLLGYFFRMLNRLKKGKDSIKVKYKIK